MLGSRDWSPTPLVLLALLCVACGPQAEEATPAASPDLSEVDAAVQTGLTASSVYGVDPSQLRFDGPKEGVLVRSGDRAFITVGQYNSWLGTYPLKIESQDSFEARRQALEQMVTFNLIVQKAREGGYAEKIASAGARPDDRSVALSYIHGWVTNTSSVTEEETREYESRESERLSGLDSPDVPEPVKMMAIKGSVRGERLWAQIKVWMEQAQISYVGAAVKTSAPGDA